MTPSQPPDSPAAEFIIGARVVCEAGSLGELKRVVIDPIARAITHLVVEPSHRRGSGHLVPVELVTAADAHEIRLSCGQSEFAELDDAEDIRFITGPGLEWDYEASQMLTSPYFPLGVGMGIGGVGTGGGGPQTVITDRVPAGEVQVRRGDSVHATDGEIGRVQGLVVDPRDHAVTHVLLEEGHLWAKKSVAIPIGAVTRVDDGVRLNLTKQQIVDLPAVDVDDLT